MNIENKSLDQGKRSVSAMHNCRYLFIWVNFNRTLEFEVGYNPCYIYTLKKKTYKEKSKAWKHFLTFDLTVSIPEWRSHRAGEDLQSVPGQGRPAGHQTSVHQ